MELVELPLPRRRRLAAQLAPAELPVEEELLALVAGVLVLVLVEEAPQLRAEVPARNKSLDVSSRSFSAFNPFIVLIISAEFKVTRSWPLFTLSPT